MNICQNGSFEYEFHIAAFSMSSGQLQLLFGILIIYLITMLGNLTIILLVCLVPKLHTPMYFFLCNLAIADVTQNREDISAGVLTELDDRITTHNASGTQMSRSVGYSIELWGSLLCFGFLDVTSTSTSVPRLLFITWTQDHRISFSCCMISYFSSFYVLTVKFSC
ncbi:unnamed protein product [Ranitomeya imitator]|uniref:G-protein coupled receptors family 1 profile domain-containing protein n=1 Tax=Ranitomeya imitator TaxID=111125 RepID=A0ABN9LBG3_9NEOB|nr:unnamed protein product [Ranitomeya imitator]